jgi:hypothetical protein
VTTRTALLAIAVMCGCAEKPAKPICEPQSTLNEWPHRIRIGHFDKLDLLFVIDNSSSMADKQAELARVIPDLIRAMTDPTSKQRVTDIHVGVITTSLGSHGTSACTDNDRARLVTGCAAGDAACLIKKAGTAGCEYESSWEAAYHFLIDPAPYAKAEVSFFPDYADKIRVEGLDETLLAERRAFLRPDSVVAVVIASDENDASLKPAGLNWYAWGQPQGKMLPGWAACGSVPDDFEPESITDYKKLHEEYRCFSCFEDPSDPGCARTWPIGTDIDAPRLRAFHQTQRFGYNFLWGRDRYVKAFTAVQVMDSTNRLSTNPLFVGGQRSSDHVVVGTLVGVPQELLKPEPDWDRLIGPIAKRDPRMVEALNATGDDLIPACGPRTAYPGLRHLRIAHDLGITAVVGSICNESYQPFIDALVARLKLSFTDLCQRGGVQVDSTGSASCLMQEVLAVGADGGKRCEDIAESLCTPGTEPCRVPNTELPPIAIEAARESMMGTTGMEGTIENGNIYIGSPKRLVCEVRQLRGVQLLPCKHDLGITSPSGWCYTQDFKVVEQSCISVTPERATFRFLGDAVKRLGSDVYAYCGRFPQQASTCG